MSLRGPRPRLASLAAGLLAAAFVALLVLLDSALPLRASTVTFPGPSNLCAAESGSAVTVRWAPITEADSYETRWAMVGGPGEVVDWTQETARIVAGTQDSTSGLSMGTHWKVRVRGGMNGMYSHFSSELYFVVGQALGCGSTNGGGLGGSQARGGLEAGPCAASRPQPGCGITTGLWSDGMTLWVAWNGTGPRDGVLAYDIATRERLAERDFRLAARNLAPRGVWSDGEVAWVSDSGQNRLFAYDLGTRQPFPARDIELAAANDDARDIWSDGATMWVLDGRVGRLFGYSLASGAALSSHALDAANDEPGGLWSDGYLIWVTEASATRLVAYRLADGELVREPDGDFVVKTGEERPRGLWSDGGLMYVADLTDRRVYFTTALPPATDARLASLSIGGVDIGPFSSAKTYYRGEPDDDWTVRARPVRPGATVAIMPTDVDGDSSNGHQVDPETVTEVNVTVTSEDGLRSRVYRVRIERTVTPEAEPEDPVPPSAGTKPTTAREPSTPRVWPGQVTVIGNTQGMGVSHRYDCRDAARHSIVGGWVDGTEVEMLGEGVGRCSGWFWVRAEGVGSWVRARFLVPSPADALEMQAPPTRWVIGNTGGLGVSYRNVCLDAARLSVVGGLLDGAEVRVMETGAGPCAGWLRVRAGEVTTWVRAQYVREYLPASKWVIRNTGGIGVSHRNACADGARLSAIGGWRDGTLVEVQARGLGDCAGWLLVKANDGTSWVRERYVERLVTPVVPDTGGG